MNEETSLIEETMIAESQAKRMALNLRFQAVCEKLVHVFGLLSFILVLVWFSGDGEGFSWEEGNKLVFNWHPVLMTLGMVFLFAESAVSYRSLNNLLPHEHKKKIHVAINTIILVLAVVGLRAVFRFHNEAATPIPNLYSLHSWLGLSTVVLFFAQYVAGFYSFFYPKLKLSNRRGVLPYHAYVGTILYVVFVTATVLTGTLEKATFSQCKGGDNMATKCYVANTFGLVIACLGCAVYLSLMPPHKSLTSRQE